jgi:hypothetical protein
MPVLTREERIEYPLEAVVGLQEFVRRRWNLRSRVGSLSKQTTAMHKARSL